MKDEGFLTIAFVLVFLVVFVAWPVLLLTLRGLALANKLTDSTSRVFGALPKWTLSPLVFDFRSLALFRILLGFVTIADLVGRASDLEAFFTDDGIFPRSAAVTKDRFAVCLNMLSGGATWQWIIFICCGILALLFSLGFRTRLITPLLWVFLISVHNRNNLLNNSGDVLLAILIFISMFLPVGACYSLDAALCPSPKEKKSSDTNKDDDEHPYGYICGGNLFLTLQLICVYFISYIYKIRSPLWWKELTAVDLALRSDHVAATASFLLARPWLTRILTAWTIILEAGIVWFPLVPIYNTFFRSFAILCFVNLHLGFKVFLDIGLFWLICVVGWLALIPTAWWDFAEKWLWNRKEQSRSAVLLYNSKKVLQYKVALILRTFVSFDQTGQFLPIQPLSASHAMSFPDTVGATDEEKPANNSTVSQRKNGNGNHSEEVLPQADSSHLFHNVYIAILEKQQQQQQGQTSHFEDDAVIHHVGASGGKMYTNWDAVHYLFQMSPVLYIFGRVIGSRFVRQVVNLVAGSESGKITSNPKGSNQIRKAVKFVDELLPLRKTSPRYIPAYLGFLACLLTVSTCWMNLADTHTVTPLPAPIASTMLNLQLRQFWGMFSLPGPQATGWYVVPTTRANGDVIDIYNHKMTPVSWDEPAFTATTFKSEFWRKYFTNLRIYKAYQPMWLHYATWLCRTINEPLVATGHPELRIKNFTITFMLRKAEPFKFAAPEKVPIWEHYCFGPIPKRPEEIQKAHEQIRDNVRREALSLKPDVDEEQHRVVSNSPLVKHKPKQQRISVSKAAISWAKKAIKAFEEGQKDSSGTVTVDGSIVDITAYNSAKDLLSTYGHLV